MNFKPKTLKEKVELYEYILDNIKAGIWVNSFDKTLWHNKMSIETHGFTTDELNEMGIVEYQKQFHHPDDAQIFEESYKSLSNPEIGRATTIFRQKDKDGKWFKAIGVTFVSKRFSNGSPMEAINCGIIIPEKLSDFTQIESLLKENAYLRNKIRLQKLTKRELEISKCLSEGLSTKQIADKKYISINTVETHKKNIYKKLNIQSVTELVRIIIECGLV